MRRPLASDGFRDRHIMWSRHLDIEGIAFDQADAMPGALRQRGLVGDLKALSGQRERVAQDVAPKRLRRLREIDSFARQGLADESASHRLAVI